MTSSECRASSNFFSSNSHNRSRPLLTSRTSPASASTCKCLVTACRVICVPDVSCAIDIAPPAHNTAMRRNRVSSPSAANTGAAFRSAGVFDEAAFAPALGRFDMLLDVFHLYLPPFAIHPENLQTTRDGYVVDARLDYSQQRTPHRILQLELHQRSGLARIVYLRVDRIRMPAPRQQLLGLNLLNGHFHDDVFVPGMRNGPGKRPAGGEMPALQPHC